MNQRHHSHALFTLVAPVLLLGASCSSPGGMWGNMAVATAPAKPPIRATDDQSRAATQSFRNALAAGRWQDLPQVTSALTAAYLDHPNDPDLALLIGHAHLWRISERNRDSAVSGDPTVTDHLILARHYFEQAAALAPQDRRIPGWLGSTEMAVGTVNNEQATIRRGYFRTRDSVAAYPQFNGFTFGVSLSGSTGEQLQEALDAMWRSASTCSDNKVTATTPLADPTKSLPKNADPACFNTPRAPHNWEGFWWTLGLMELKAGHTELGRTALENAKRSAEYASWPFRAAFETDLAESATLAVQLAKGDPAAERRMIFGSPVSCVACHQR